jgi:hypothetical protein
MNDAAISSALASCGQPPNEPRTIFLLRRSEPEQQFGTSSFLAERTRAQLVGAESPPAGVLVPPFNHFQGFAKTPKRSQWEKHNGHND